MPNLVGIGLSQVPTNSMLGGMAYQDPDRVKIKKLNVDEISQINSEIADTAVDIFIYDTSKDSDGGAWRKKTTHTSWYNETLGTATRGTRREFPAVAVIVAKGDDTITIYDGDDPNLPMWMVMPVLTGWDSTTKVSALNGIIVMTNHAYNGTMFHVKFIEDSYNLYDCRPAVSLNSYTSRISDRATVASYSGTQISNIGLVNADINDVAMTVLPNAPIDSATGLPVPTIAVATAGGISIIKDDGNVYDSGDGLNWNFIDISETKGRKVLNYGFSGGATVRHKYIDSINSDYGSGALDVDYEDYPNGTVSVTAANDVYASQTRGIAIYDRWNDPGSYNNTNYDDLLAFVTSDYNTGWMHGDIKGAFLSDTDATNITGGNIVTNGDAWTGAQSSTSTTPPNGWTGGNAAQWRTSTGGDGSYIRLVNAGSSQGGPNSYMYQAITTVPGRKYNISLTQYHHATISVYYSVGTSINGGELVTSTWVSSSSNTPRYEQNTFTATGTTTYLTLGITSGTNNYDTGWDNVVVTEVDEDRSVNANGLHSYGTITKSAVATGAELVGYSFGNSNANYLKQPANLDFQFGTGDFSAMVWINMPDYSQPGFIFDRSDLSGNERFAWYVEGDDLKFYTFDGASASEIGLNTVEIGSAYDGKWVHCVATRHSSGLMEEYINGVLIHSQISTVRQINNADAHMVVGGRYNNTSGNEFDGSIALLRISGSIPSAAQVKKMYEDEKFLFQENAKATLYGSSDAVTALAYDEVTGRLHAGTSEGRSDFQGLRRINNTTTAVTTAISAHDGFIVEQ